MIIRPYIHIIIVYIIYVSEFFFINNFKAKSVLKNFIFLQANYRVDNSFMFNIN